MATASTKAIEVLSSTDQTENYQRLSRLIVRAGTELLRALFDSFYPPSILADKLSESATMDMLRKALLKPQRTVVYPASGPFGESRDFDMSLLSQLLKTLCQTKLPPLDSGWDRLPSPSNSTLTADIVRIKVYRNDIFHKHYNGELDYVEFCSLWNESKVALLSIAYQISPETKREWEEAIERLWCDPLTPEAARDAEELQKMYWNDMITKEYLASGFARVEKKIQILSKEVKEGFDGLKSEIEKLGEALRNRASSSAAEGGGQFKEEIVLL